MKTSWPLSNYFITFAFLLIVVMIMILEIKEDANEIATYIYYFLVVGIIIRIFEFILPSKIELSDFSQTQKVLIVVFMILLPMSTSLIGLFNYIDNSTSVYSNISIKDLTNISIYDGPFYWNNSSNDSIDARYYPGWKIIITNKEQQQSDAITCKAECIYKFPLFSTDGRNSFNSTLIYIKTGSSPYKIYNIFENGQPSKDIVGIWWETDWIGMSTNEVIFPVEIPSNQKAIIQMGHNARNVYLESTDLDEFKNDAKMYYSKPIFGKPAKYEIYRRFDNPFLLTFLEKYNPQWKIYIYDDQEKSNFIPFDMKYLFIDSYPDKYHFEINDTNKWYIDPKNVDRDTNGKSLITIYFWPQSLFYFELVILIITISVGGLYIYYLKKTKTSVSR